MSNLDRERPAGWSESSLFSFVEDSWSNAVATYHHMQEEVARLERVDALFTRFSSDGLTNPSNYFAGLLFIRAHTAYRVASGLALATPTECYSVLRSSLEYAGYALFCDLQPSLAEIWLRRDETAESLQRVRREFTQTKVREAIGGTDRGIADRYQRLYEETISWGAHPNEKALTSSLRVINDLENKRKTIQVIMLPHGGTLQKLALRRCAQVGVCVLEIFSLVYPERFDLLGITSELPEVRRGL